MHTTVRYGFAALALFTAVAALTMTLAAQDTILYSFYYGTADGLAPYGGLVARAGNLYGTCALGGAVGQPFGSNGTVYELSPASGGGWTEKILWNFGSVAGDGSEPVAAMIFDAKGNLYGTTSKGGANGGGTVFELVAGTGGTWTEKVLYSFGASTTDGVEPGYGRLTFDAKGNLYGTTLKGGANGVGTVFELVAGAGGTWTEKVLYNFGAGSTDAASPYSGVTFDAAGNIYGTTANGGAFSCSTFGTCGTVYQLKPGSSGWTEKILHSFNYNNTDGFDPIGGVIFDQQGNLYGTTKWGGNFGNQNGFGTVFELTPLGGTWTETVLYSFTGSTTNADGQNPLSDLVFDAAGDLYGTTEYGGAPQVGTVFALMRGAGSWKEKLVYTFSDNTTDGRNPVAGVIFDAAGNLYGTTTAGGINSFQQDGLAYEVPKVVTAAPHFTPPGGGYSTGQSVKLSDATAGASIFYSINNGPSTHYTGPISVATSETISAFAATSTLPQSQSTVASYQIGSVAATPLFSPAPGTFSLSQAVTITDAAPKAVIHYTTDGTTPTASSPVYHSPVKVLATETIKALAIATGYTTSAVASGTYTITPITLPQEKVLYSFGATANDGGVPYASLILDSKGNLYGTTEYGGTNQITYGLKTVTAGTVFELSPKTGGGWTEIVLYDFGASSTDSALPIAGLVFDSQGNLYGTTFAGGTCGLGTVFELSPKTGGGWTEKVLHSFGCTLTDGEVPDAPLIFDSKGNLFGTTEAGGIYDTTYGGASNGYGTVFELSPGSGGTWTEQVLYSFSYLSRKDGFYPVAGLIMDSKGNLYGTTMDGGVGWDLEGGGSVFELTPAGSTWTEKVLYNFPGGASYGYRLAGGLVMDTAGNLYGTAEAGGNGFGLDGTVFELSPGSSGWTLNVLHSFGAYTGDGINPSSTLVFDAAGNLYGTTTAGGANGYGTVFEMIPQTGGGWTEVTMHSFNLSNTDGAIPYVGLIPDAAGNLYGTTGYGGPHTGPTDGTAGGTVFELVHQ